MRTYLDKWAVTCDLSSPDVRATRQPPEATDPNIAGTRGSVAPRPDRVVLDAGAIGGSAFELQETIGEGGMGVVWRARQASLQREVALKQQKAGDRGGARFLAEALITGRLDHPNIIPVHTLGQDERGQLFLAMKMAEGVSWRELLHPRSDPAQARARTLGIEDHLRTLIAVCNAVAYAHRKRVIHRDLKPDNVMVGELGEVWVCDWGVALALDDPTMPHDAFAGPAGTPAYMAPEQARCDGSQVSERTDVYLLGAILYELLRGEPPHDGADLRTVLAHAAEAEPAPLPSDIPAELRAIVATAMARRPQDRHPSAEAVRDALVHHLAHRQALEILARARAEAAAIAAEVGGDAHQRYARHARVLDRFEQAHELWPEHAEASAGAIAARLAYADAAFSGGDLGLAEAQLRPDAQASADERALRQRIVLRRAEIGAARATTRRLRLMLVVAAAALITGAAGAAVAIAHKEARAAGAEADRAREGASRLSAELDAARIRADAAAKSQRRLLAFEPYAQALDLLLRGQLPQRAAELCEQALDADPEFIEAEFTLGEALRQSGLSKRAASAYLAANDLSVTLAGKPNLPALLAAGFCAESAGDYTAAEWAFTRARELGSDDPLARVGEAVTDCYHRRFAHAIGLAKQAASDAPHLWECHYVYGYALTLASDEGVVEPRRGYRDAAASLTLAQTMAPRQADVCQLLGRALNGSDPVGRAALVQDLADRAVALEPLNGNRLCARVLSGVFAGNGDRIDADLLRAQALDANPALIAYAEATLPSTPPDQALDRLTALAHDHPEWPGLAAQRFTALLAVPERRRAEWSDFETWASAHPDDPAVDAIRASAAQQDHDVPTVLASIDRALAQAPYRIQLHILRANVLETANRPQEALDSLSNIGQHAASDERVQVERLGLLCRLARWAEADEAVSNLVRDHPKRADLSAWRERVQARRWP